ncbi:MAG: hypothetical protein KDA41_21555, partial [Planctomycetales bacterium]|nr:hypothetical protein [Planctomycetales bacterium]
MARKKRKPSKLSRLASMIGRDILAARGSLLAFELLYKLVAAGLLSSAAGALVALLVASSGSAAINNDAIATFAATPRGLLTGLVAATLAFAIAFTEQAGLLVIAGRQAKGQPA